MDIAILMGCDIEWQPYSDPSSSGAATASEAVLASGKSDDDKSGSDAEALVTKAASKGAEPAGLRLLHFLRLVQAGAEPAAAPQQPLVIAANAAADNDENAPIFKAVNPSNFFEWDPLPF